MKKILSTGNTKHHITFDTQEMGPILYNMLRSRGLLVNDENQEPHPNFAMASPLTRRLIENTAEEFTQRLNLSVEFTS